MLCVFVLGVDRYSRVTKHSFRPCRSHLNVAVLALYRILDMPEVALLLGVFDLRVRKCGDTVRTPVDYSVTSIYKSLVVEVYEYLADCLRAALVHSEALARPVAGSAELLELTYDAVSVLMLPVPDSLKEFFSAKVVACEPLVYSELLLDLYLRCDTRVVCSGNPKGVVALHSLIADENVLQGFVESVSHMELTRYVRGRNDHRKMRRGIIYVGGEISLFRPVFVYSVLEFRGGIYLR